MVSQYEEAVENDLRTMAESSGFVCRKAEAGIDGDEKKETFGHVVSVSLRLAPDSSGQADQGGSSSGIQPVEPVEPIEPVERIRVELNGGSEEVSETIGASAGQPDKRQEENSALAGLRRHISEYYDLEEQDIEIQLENK